ncbi:T9SS type A sorting domain-containing protein [Mariniflexile soesokkakense]|uniref:T9SS type A sorting domain-containing protein n=1 Tax=Mariniflexile soesokkakense TaxID=1343160 RepID=A0ABV0ABH6_9FLAO
MKKKSPFLLFYKWTFLLTLFLSSYLAIAQTNLAMLNSTQTSTSHVSPWENLNSVNDGFTPTSSSDRTRPIYGNWNGDADYGKYNWVEYQWNFAHSISSVSVYWFSDGGGLIAPSDAYIQYWDGLEWINAGAIGKALNTFNTLSDLAINTSKIRVNMKSATSTGIIEFQVFGIETTECDSTPITSSVIINGTPEEQNFAVVNAGEVVELIPASSTDLSLGKMKWTGPNNFVSNELALTLSNLQSNNSGTYTFLYVNACGRTSSTDFYLTVKDAVNQFTNWPAYDNTLHYDFKSDYPDFPVPIKNLEEDYPGYNGCDVAWSRDYGSWTFNAGPNANPLVTTAAVDGLLKRLDEDFSYLRNNMGWPPDKLYRAGYRSSVYLFGSGLCTDNASNTDLGGWQSGVGTQDGQSWPMVLLSYYPVNSFDPNTTFPDAAGQRGACVHEGIHAIYASLPGCRDAAWFHEGSNVWLQMELDIQKSGLEDFRNIDLGWLSMGSVMAPFIPIECYSGWLQDGTFGGPKAQGVSSGIFNSQNQELRKTRDVIGGVQYSSIFPTFLGEIVDQKSLPWIWNYCEGYVLEGIANGNGTVNGIGDAKTRTLIQEYRARLALSDFGKYTEGILNMYRNNMGRNVGPERPALIDDLATWKATPYAKTTKDSEDFLIPEERTLPGWSGANIVPIHVTGTDATVFFQPLGKNMTMRLCYRTKAGAAFYSKPTYAGDATISFAEGQPANGVIFAVIANSDYIYEGESTRTSKFNYKLKLGSGAIQTAGVDKNWFDWKVDISEPLSTNDFSSNASSFTIYPNPTQNGSAINIKLQNNTITNYNVEVLSLNGQVLYKKDNCKSDEQLSSSKLSKGIYFVTIKTENFKQTKKIVIQ